MKEIIRVTVQDGQQVVSAKELHEYLEVKTKLIIWCQRMFKYGFEENQDYTAIKFENPVNQQITIQDYALTLDAAKEISMLQRTEKGKQARKYFIETEKAFKNQSTQEVKPLSSLELLKLTVKAMDDQQKQINEVQKEVERLKAKSTTRQECYSIAGYASLNGIYVGLTQAAGLGRKATSLCKKESIQVDNTHDPRFGKVNIYPIEILRKVFIDSGLIAES